MNVLWECYGNVLLWRFCQVWERIFQYFFGKKKLVVNMIIFYYKHFLYMLYKILCLIPSRAIVLFLFLQ